MVVKVKRKPNARIKKSMQRKPPLAGKAAKRGLGMKRPAGKARAKSVANAARGRKAAGKTGAQERGREPQKQKKELAAIYKRRNEMLTTALGRQQIISLGGENAISVISSFSRDMSDEELAKKAEIKVSEVRAVLNRLHSVGLVEYVREKDATSGWYSYVWRMKGDSTEKFLKYCSCAGIEGAKEEYKGRELYYCRSCRSKSLFVFEEALGRSFVCDCGKKLEYLEEAERILVLGERE